MKKFLVVAFLVSILAGVGVCGNNRPISSVINANTNFDLLENGCTTWSEITVTSVTTTTIPARAKRIGGSSYIVNLASYNVYATNILFSATSATQAAFTLAEGMIIWGTAVADASTTRTNVFKLTTDGAWYVSSQGNAASLLPSSEIRVIDTWSNIR